MDHAVTGNTFWLWVVLSSILLSFWPSVTHVDLYGVPFHDHGAYLWPHLVLVLGHAAAGIVLWLIWTNREHLFLSDVISVVLSCEALSLLFLMLTRSEYSQSILLGTVSISIVCYLALYSYLGLRNRASRLGILSLLSLATIVTVVGALGQPVLPFDVMRSASQEERKGREERLVDSAFYPLKVTEYSGHVSRPMVQGGGIVAYGDGLLLVTGDGAFYRMSLSNPDAVLAVEELQIQVPLNAAEFQADAPKEAPTERFRVADLLVQRVADTTRIYVSHHFWKRGEQCHVMRVSKLEWISAEIEYIPDYDSWDTMYETYPCIEFDDYYIEFDGHMSGGRMQLLNNVELLLTVGNLGFDGLFFDAKYAQSSDASYGKVIRVNIIDGSAEIYSSGHRNPQGLYVTSDGTIWSTEHGPKGGDELNLILEGRNYGWPFVTYGTLYDSYEWPLNERQARHDSFEAPVYAWVPSIGVSNLIASRGTLFPFWEGDLLVASLRFGALYRIHLKENRAIVIEPIELGGRLRDLTEDSTGRIIFWTDAGSILIVRPADQTTEPSVLFLKHCGGCHELQEDDRHSIGPNLRGVFGRAIGSADGYQYSDALRNLSDIWSEEALRSFLGDPDAYAPGTTMDFRGLTSSEEIARITEYLRSLD